MSQLTDDNKSFKLAAFCLGGLFVGAVYSQVKLQTWERPGTFKLAKDSHKLVFNEPEPARRGAILAADAKPLAEDEESYGLTVVFKAVPHCDAFYLELAEATGIPAGEFESLADSGVKKQSWLDPISGDRHAAVEAIKKKWRANGIALTPAGRRTYPLGSGAAGFVGVIREYAGAKKGEVKVVRTGLEKSLNAELSGVNGHKVGLTDRNGDFLPMRLGKGNIERRDGKDVELTIDRDVQTVASDSLKLAVESHHADYGVAMVMNPKTGEILAMANWPSFEPNDPTASQGNFGFNPAYMAQLEPGSMFKVLTLAKGIDDGKIKLTDSINCAGEWHPTETSKPIHCDSHHGNRAHGTITTIDAIARSCNVSAAIWACRIGRQPMFDFIDKLHLVALSKARKDLYLSTLDLPGELHGLLRRNEYAERLQLATIGFGQSITCTPTDLLGAFGMIGNNGFRAQPHLIAKIGGSPVVLPKPSQIVQPETADAVLKCMEMVIQSDEGTGKKLSIPGYRMAGKTGTAQKVGKGQHGYVSNFVGFVPAQDPKAVIRVMVNNPKLGGYYGADVAGPVFHQLARSVIRHYNIPPTEPITSDALKHISLKKKTEPTEKKDVEAL